MIVTHVNPDLDAIGATWLLKRFSNLVESEVRFVNTGNPDPALLEEAQAVVDTGKEYDPIRLRFDHHQLPGQQSNDTCATKQVFDYLLPRNPTIAYLSPLIELIFAGDTGRQEANYSRELGLHALLSGFKSSASDKDIKLQDQTIMMFGFDLLDMMESRLRHQAVAKAELAEKVIYKSDDNLVWAILEGSQGSSYAAYEEGARIVIFQGEPIETENGLSYPVGIMRSGEWQEPHCGQLVQLVQNNLEGDEPMYHELNRWFRHNSGFFAGRGTAKAPVYEPAIINLGLLAMMIDGVWKR